MADDREHTDPAPDPPPAPVPHADMALVRRILAGQLPAWHEFLERYSALVRHVVSRYIADRDDARTVCVDILADLYHAKLAQYEGRAALSTWIVMVARHAALDEVRRRTGRRKLPRGVRGLEPFDRRVFELYFLEGKEVEAVRHRLEADDRPTSVGEILEALRRIDEAISDRALRRVMYDLSALSVGATSGRVLEYLDHVHVDYSGDVDPETIVIRDEARQTARALLTLLDSLPATERRVLSLRFEKGWSAARIADEVGGLSPQGVYSLIYRVRKHLRRRIGRLLPDSRSP